MKQKIRLVAMMLLMVALLTACGGGGDYTGANNTNALAEVSGQGVKAPLAGAVVYLYSVDLSQTDLKGTLLDEGWTGSNAAIKGLSIKKGLSGLVLLEFVADADTVEVGTNAPPVIDRLVTIIDVQRIYDHDDIYATPLTTMVVKLAQAKADTGAPYSGNGDDTISSDEFIAALAIAQNQVKSTVGFGLDSSVDVFTVPPLLTSKTSTEEEQTKVVKHRQAIEAVAALAEKVADESSADDSAQEIFDGLTEDLEDGTIDGRKNDTPVTKLAALDMPIDITLNGLDPATLVIPNTNKPITDIKQVLTDEMADTEEVVDAAPLDAVDVNPAPPELVAVSNDTYSVGGTVSGLAGSLVLQNNGGNDLTLSAYSTFAFSKPVDDGADYNVTILSQPAGQTCVASSNSGTVNGTNVTDVVVTCSTHTYTIGGNVTGLTGSVVLQNNGGNDLTINADGAFTFSTPIAYGHSYNVSVLTQPAGQSCTASTNTGTVSEANVTNVTVICSTNTYTVGGTVSGLPNSTSVTLQNNGGDDLTVNADGTFTFATGVTDGSGYNVTILSQSPGVGCSISSNTGTVNSANVANVALTCAVTMHTIGGNVSGLSGTLVLRQANGNDDLTINADGAFVFANSLPPVTYYSVSVLTQPTGQTCTVSNGTGVVADDVTNVAVSCTTHSYIVGGNVSGLTGSVVLQNSGGDDLTVNADGNFAFSMPVIYGGSYSVSVLSQPAGQTCAASNNTGTVGNANVVTVAVTCADTTYTIGGNVTGLSGSMVLQNNSGDDLTVNADGAFAFNTSVVDGSAYNVTVLSQPVGQTCSASTNTGTVNSANVTNVVVTCSAATYTIGGSVSGLSGSVVLQNSGGDDLTLNADGVFTFATSVANGAGYNVTVLTQPAGQSCAVSSNSGTVSGANVSTVSVSCLSGYTIGGTVSGLSGSIVLQNNGGDDLTVNADGAFAFSTPVVNSSSYSVAVSAQPNEQTCTLINDSGTVSGTDITNVAVTCVAAALDAVASPGFATLSWSDTGATSYNLYYSTAPGCDISNYASCPGAAMVLNVTSPYVVNSLTNGQSYWFRIESVVPGSNGISNEAGAVPDKIIVNGTVNAIAHDANGTTYLGGDFTSVGMRTGYGVVTNPASGTAVVFPVVNDKVYAVIPDGADGYYIGGDFTSVGGQTRNHLAHILADGSLGAWNPDANDTVRAMLLDGNTIYVGGDFTTIAGQTRNTLAAIGTDGVLDNTWTPDCGGTVNALAISGNTIYVGGTFGGINGATRNYMAAIGTDGTLSDSWNPVTSWMGGSYGVNALAVVGDTVYVGGRFDTIDGVAHKNLFAIGTDGTLSAWAPDPDYDVYSMAVSGSTLYLGGRFYQVDGNIRVGLAALDTSNNNAVTDWNPSITGPAGKWPQVHTLFVSDSTIYFGGHDFTKVNGTSRKNNAAVDTNGTLLPWAPTPTDYIRAIAASGDTVYLGGDFTMLNPQGRYRLAAINADGTLSSTWNPGANSYVNTLVVSGNTVYAGGYFTKISGTTRNYLAAIDTDGTLNAWNPNADDEVMALAISGSTLYISGAFYHIGADYRDALAAIDTDGTLSTTWTPIVDSVPQAITVSGSTVYLGGGFTTVDDGKGGGVQARGGLAALGTDGYLTAWTGTIDNLGVVKALAVADSTVYIGGSFTTVNGNPRNRLAAIGTDSTLSSAWVPNVGVAGVFNAGVHALAVSGSTVYIGGSFLSVDGNGRYGLAAVDTDGTLNSWKYDLSDVIYAYEAEVNALSISNGMLNVGGYFDMVGSNFSTGYATVAP